MWVTQGDPLWGVSEQGAQAQPPASHDWEPACTSARAGVRSCSASRCPASCPNMPSACHHHALDGACPGSPHPHCTVPREPPLSPSETELWRGAGEWVYPVTKGGLGRSPPSFHNQGPPPIWFSDMQVPHFVNLLTYWFH